MFWKIDIKLLYKLVVIFILMTIAGTLHHETGHYIAAKFMGRECSIHYASTRTLKQGMACKAFTDYLDSLNLFNDSTTASTREETFRKLHSIDARFKNLSLACGKEGRIFAFGGPLITMLTGTIGFVILLLVKVKSKTESLNYKQYSLVFISLLWLRQPMNLAMGLMHYLMNPGRRSYSDEFHMAAYFNLNHWSILIITGILGFTIATYIVFRIIPIKERLTFILSSFIGGLFGYYLWLVKFGPIIMP